LDVGQELEHGGGEVGRGDGVVEVVLQAVEVEVDDGDLAVELGVERDGCVGRRRVHDLCDRGRDVCVLLARTDAEWQEGKRTRPQPPLVNPAVHLGALLLQLLDPVLHVCKLRLQLVNLVRIRADGLLEGLGQQVGHRFRLARGQWRRGVAQPAHGRHAVAVGVGEAAGRVRRFLGSLLAGIHVLFVRGRRRGNLVGGGGGGVVVVIVVGGGCR
jgi:hypothetical protein